MIIPINNKCHITSKYSYSTNIEVSSNIGLFKLSIGFRLTFNALIPSTWFLTQSPLRTLISYWTYMYI